MAEKRKTKAARSHSSVLSRFGCDLLSYDFKVPLSSFDPEGFSRAIGLSGTKQWNVIYNPKDHVRHHYHVHFDGKLSDNEVTSRLNTIITSGTLEREEAPLPRP